MENLSIYEQSGFQEVTMPCAACFNRHKAALYEIRQHEIHKASMDKDIGYAYKDTVQVTTLIQSIHNHVGTEVIVAKVTNPLTGLNVVCYYGCLLTRPPKVTALGSTVHDWSYNTSCCGAAHSLDRPEIVLKLSSNIIAHAREAGADAIVVACPLCHTNLDARQFQMKLEQPMPVFFFSQLMVLALGLPEHAAMLNKNLVDPIPLLKDKGLLS
jgi:heterodisulfide reductase subunit B